jgi:foldase protein PrsA
MPYLNRVAVSLASLALVMAVAGCSGSSGSGGSSSVVTVNGDAITKADLDNKLESAASGKQVLNQLVQAKLVDQYAAANHIDVTDAEIQKKEDEIKAKYPPGQFEQILKQQNLTEADVHTILRQTVVIEKAVDKDIHVSDADVKAYFDKNHATLDKPAQVRARHILVPDLKTALNVEAQLKAGGNFDALAKKYSTDPSTKDKGGELGFFGKGQMVKPFEDAAMNGKVGSTTAPVKSPFGYHIINIEEKKPATVATLASAHDQIVTTLKQQQEQTAIPAFLQGLRAKANIQVNDPRFADAFPSPLPVPPAAGAAAGASAAAAPSAAAPSPAASPK